MKGINLGRTKHEREGRKRGYLERECMREKGGKRNILREKSMKEKGRGRSI
jgi:hypothetical protein